MIEKLFELLDPDTIIITPNRRLAATFHKFYTTYQIKKGHLSWQQPVILPYITWIQWLWKNVTQTHFQENTPLLLNDFQEQFLWEGILTQSKENHLLLQISETANLVKSAWTLLHQWQVSIQHSMFQISEDYIAFQKWCTEFQALCNRNHWITQQNLVTLLLKKIVSKQIQLPQKIYLLGFNELTPEQEYFFNQCRLNAISVEQVDFTKDNTFSQRINLDDFATEIVTMARWAKSIYQENPNATIGCIIPDLNMIRDRVQQLFSEVFASESSFAIDPLTSPFNISAGKNLNLYPVIHAALQFLSLSKMDIPLYKLSSILTSAFLGAAETELFNRVRIDNILKQKNLTSLNLQHLLSQTDSYSQQIKKLCPLFYSRIEQFVQAYDVLNNNTYPLSEWSQHFSHLLNVLGWPGERSLTSEEFQTVDQWLNLLQQFKTLDLVSEPVSYHQALQLLQKLISKNVFQAKTPETRIQILGVLEAAAIPFDYLWVAGMDDHAWPSPANPNPFIPKPLQRELNMPHATAQRELEYCKELTLQFQKNANYCIFSYATKHDTASVQASPLISHLAEITLEQLALEFYHSPQQRIFKSKDLESIIDNNGPSYVTDTHLEGGANIIKQQALCPFKAFAECRLKIHSVDESTLGLADKDRGTILHKALENIWLEIKNQTALNLMSEPDLDAVIQRNIQVALLNYLKSPSLPQSIYLDLEIKRLKKLITRWLNIEKQRPTFNVIATEYKTQLTFNNISLSLRIDRIDELSDGKKLIIDYKTGKKVTSKNWFDERSKEPQLPLYFLVDPINTIGITFAQIHAKEIKFKGVSRDNLQIKGIDTEFLSNPIPWEQQIIQWQSSFSHLIHDFYAGFAKVNPLDTDTCNHCHLHAFCRINQTDEFNDCE